MHIRDLTQFLAELAENNNRAWFVMNKPRYDILRAEFLELVTKLIADLGKFDPAVAGCNPKKALFRINRDMRFSKEKIPYKTHFSAAINASGLKRPHQGGGPTYYFHINETGTLLIAAGEWMPPPERLRAIRQHVIDDAAGFTKLLKNKKLKETYGELQEEGKLSRPPKGFDADVPHLEYIKLKNFIVWHELDVRKVADLGKMLASDFKDAYPLVTWLRQA
ncbi:MULTISPECIES: DUF2461 domain-containing protein [Oxalobacteraceae]|uniref:DUF2461 domain-containing protein n=1 Tax=Herminiimonas contaminans TaxID=1111140 RepID=A0ABS0EXG7_9BURK|nr:MULTISPECIES: DUF2461 domain-containing protein [Oxalobacteraceae]MBF8178517.1 DUF2461 domain-containing protein [Herminiimonas contaminans]